MSLTELTVLSSSDGTASGLRGNRAYLLQMSDERFAEHLINPRGRAHEPAGGHSGVAGGTACGDLVHLRVAVENDRVSDAGFEAAGCGATIAAASAAVELVEGAPLLEAARVNSAKIAAALGG